MRKKRPSNLVFLSLDVVSRTVNRSASAAAADIRQQPHSTSVTALSLRFLLLLPPPTSMAMMRMRMHSPRCFSVVHAGRHRSQASERAPAHDARWGTRKCHNIGNIT